MREIWATETCPNCKAKNWINCGDPDDFTVPDIEAIECWSCDHLWAPETGCPILDEDIRSKPQDDWLATRGKKSPEDR